MRMKLSEYLVERNAQTELARAIGAQPQLIWQWTRAVRPVPIERCMPIERATGGKVTRRDLRPDDWQEIWPELAEVHASRPSIATETVAKQRA